jgi:hypothetical protein
MDTAALVATAPACLDVDCGYNDHDCLCLRDGSNGG